MVHYHKALGRNENPLITIYFDQTKTEENSVNQIIEVIKKSSQKNNEDKQAICLLIDPFFDCKTAKKIIQACCDKKMNFFIESNCSFPDWSIKQLMKSCDNEAVAVLYSMDDQKREDCKDPSMDILRSILKCFKNGVHVTLKIPEKFPDDISEYDLISVISLLKNWIHVVSIDTSIVHPNIIWKHITDFVLGNKLDLIDRKDEEVNEKRDY